MKDADRCYECSPKCAKQGCGKLVRVEGWFCHNHRPRCALYGCGQIVSKVGHKCKKHFRHDGSKRNAVQRLSCVRPGCTRSVKKPDTKCDRCVDKPLCTVCGCDALLEDIMRCHSHAKRCARYGCKQYTSKTLSYCDDCRCNTYIRGLNEYYTPERPETERFSVLRSECVQPKNGKFHCKKCSSSFQLILILKRIMNCREYTASIDIICMILRFAKLPFPTKKINDNFRFANLQFPSENIVTKVNDS